MSVNYCQLSSPGYKEEQLRREEVGLNLFSGNMEEFKFVSYARTGGRAYYRSQSTDYRNIYFYDMTNIQFEPKTSSYFDITVSYTVRNTNSYFTAKETGLYAFHSEKVEMTIDDKWISNNDDGQNYIMASVALVKKGQMIKFRIEDGINAEGSTLTIFKIK